jgi:SAM-dependent methyltransferase
VTPTNVTSGWPKQRPQLTAAQRAAMEDWYQVFLGEVLPGKYGWVDRFNHRYALRSAVADARTLEIGPGNGSHLDFEDLSSQREYVALEMRESLSRDIVGEYPNLRVVVGDCQAPLEFPDDWFDRVLAIHVLEHLDNLPAALDEIARVLKPSGRFSVVIPAEGGLGYSLGRRVTVQRRFERRYHMPYEWMIRYDHVNVAREVMAELSRLFVVEHRQFFPLAVPSVDLNLVIGLTLRLREVSGV